MRQTVIDRQTSETHVHVALDLDGTGQHAIFTGIGFLDHLMAHLAVHGLFDLSIQATGDLQVDSHHTAEDVALTLGKAFDQALGDRKGIVRIASAYVPMDEALAFVAVDLSGRPYSVTDTEWAGSALGSLPVTLVPHLIQSLATSMRATIHARVYSGHDDHHRAEALFKALARALGAATSLESRRAGNVPSTKGVL